MCVSAVSIVSVALRSWVSVGVSVAVGEGKDSERRGSTIALRCEERVEEAAGRESRRRWSVGLSQRVQLWVRRKAEGGGGRSFCRRLEGLTASAQAGYIRTRDGWWGR
jgi:hypothetical protein